MAPSTPRSAKMSPRKSEGIPMSVTLSMASDGSLSELSERLVGRNSGRIGLVGRCHQAPQRVLEQDYVMSSKVLGTGYSGSIRLATSKRGGQRVAVKSFGLKGLDDSKRSRLQSEVEVFLCMDHPHIARLLDVYETDTQISLVMECVEGGELFERMTKVKSLSEKEAAGSTRQMLLALHYLHDHGITHRDLKLENFLYDHENGNLLKMIDFGFSKYSSVNTRMKTSCGTLAYVAPEVLKKSYTSQCDLWSMGVIVFILISGHMPFHGDSDDQLRDIKRGRFEFKPEHWRNISSAGKQFVQSLLEMDPARRLTAKGALEHTWIVQNYTQSKAVVGLPVIDAIRSWSKAPKLQRACLSMMAWSLNNKQQALVRDYFLALDKDHDGAISRTELQAAMEGKLDMPRMEADIVFSAFDGEEIKYSDFLAAMISTCIEIDDDLLHSAFAHFDADGSGYIDSSELRGILGGKFEGADVDALFDEADATKDGKIDYKEFSDYAQNYHPGTLLMKVVSSQRLVKVDSSQLENNVEEGPVVDTIEVVPNLPTSNACCVVQ
mmetsp:Transcript_25558/g.40957  ORF Transcript_25558/g.40957 Transcript_25558/m.40957 type:complete len:550 (-) Transcript_25558:208-1857(-)|eukprot:CAMPEP_0169123372 /NCGR_PEP_ID=MMETSP1015-20121227/33751_1 /TAXON_ID=342587 /ORGANISM="Karlodinium micrum, Strain CCMP2283" /LENGTH=549 /DNA_ID=CAMNT_0009186707 /DNA_START=48 /DNA_END=1697 /DNA_ORIENTATION=+